VTDRRALGSRIGGIFDWLATKRRAVSEGRVEPCAPQSEGNLVHSFNGRSPDSDSSAGWLEMTREVDGRATGKRVKSQTARA
jgi:hypothetical protein